MKFNKIAIIGVGLIGGSIGLAVKKRKLAKVVVGICRRDISAKKAAQSKAVDKATLDLEEGLKGADLVIIATSVGKIVDRAREVVKYAKDKIILTDVGSTKKEIVTQVEKMCPSNVKFVGAHPMAGSEKSGVESASDNLFEGSICIITRTKTTDNKALDRLKKFWTLLGATCKELSPDKHDRYISFVSHLPHIAAIALTIVSDAEALEYAATGFKNTTRIASSNPELWKDIFESNKKAVLESLYEYRKALESIENSIRENDAESLIGYLQKAKRIRDQIK